MSCMYVILTHTHPNNVVNSDARCSLYGSCYVNSSKIVKSTQILLFQPTPHIHLGEFFRTGHPP
jgi:hypothetical protein